MCFVFVSERNSKNMELLATGEASDPPTAPTYEIQLLRPQDGGALGISVDDENVVTKLVPNMPAAVDGRMRIGDKVLKVNSISLGGGGATVVTLADALRRVEETPGEEHSPGVLIYRFNITHVQHAGSTSEKLQALVLNEKAKRQEKALAAEAARETKRQAAAAAREAACAAAAAEAAAAMRAVLKGATFRMPELEKVLLEVDELARPRGGTAAATTGGASRTSSHKARAASRGSPAAHRAAPGKPRPQSGGVVGTAIGGGIDQAAETAVRGVAAGAGTARGAGTGTVGARATSSSTVAAVTPASAAAATASSDGAAAEGAVFIHFIPPPLRQEGKRDLPWIVHSKACGCREARHVSFLSCTVRLQHPGPEHLYPIPNLTPLMVPPPACAPAKRVRVGHAEPTPARAPAVTSARTPAALRVLIAGLFDFRGRTARAERGPRVQVPHRQPPLARSRHRALGERRPRGDRRYRRRRRQRRCARLHAADARAIERAGEDEGAALGTAGAGAPPTARDVVTPA